MSSDDDRTATPPQKVTPPMREGDERKGGERKETVESSGCGYLSDESDMDG